LGKQSKLHVGQNRDVIPLPGLETEIAVTGIHILHNRNNGMLVMYYNVSKVHECMAYRSKMTKTIIGVHNRGYYVSPHKNSGWPHSVAWSERRCTKSTVVCTSVRNSNHVTARVRGALRSCYYITLTSLVPPRSANRGKRDKRSLRSSHARCHSIPTPVQTTVSRNTSFKVWS